MLLVGICVRHCSEYIICWLRNCKCLFGKGKANAMKIIQTERIYQEAFQQLGQEWEHSEELFEKLEAFALVLYDQIKCGKRYVN